MNSKSRSKKSICEKSMKLMTNIVKVSFISIAKIGFRPSAPSQPLARATHNPAQSLPRNLRSQEAAVSYVVHPGDTNRSSMSMIKDDDQSVDQQASDYIKKVREKNLKDATDTTNPSEFILPPPPHFMLKSSARY